MPHAKFNGRRTGPSEYRKRGSASRDGQYSSAPQKNRTDRVRDDRERSRTGFVPEHRNYMDDRLPYPDMKPLFPPLTHRISAFLDQKFLRALRGVWPLNRAHRATLAADTAALSSLLTVNRSEMRSPYWSSPAAMSAYLYYFLPWNLIRLCRLFSGLELPEPPADAPSLLLDLGSGPLTVPLALWLSHPEWRSRPIEVVAVDAAGRPPRIGRDILRLLCEDAGVAPWTVHVVQAPIAQAGRRAADFAGKGMKPWLLTAANVLNELPPSRKSRLMEDDDEDEEEGAAPASEGTLEGVLSSLAAFLDRCEDSSAARMLFIEPGTRLGGLTLMRLRAIAREMGLRVTAPCPHDFGCPLARPDEDEEDFAEGPGLTSRLAGRTWCHYTFDSLGAPAWLEKLSIEAGLQKASLSLAVLELGPGEPEADETGDGEGDRTARPEEDGKIACRVISQPFRVPFLKGAARYACSAKGLLLLEDSSHVPDGAFLKVALPGPGKTERDGRSGALIIRAKGGERPSADFRPRENAGRQHPSGGRPDRSGGEPGRAPAQDRKPVRPERRPFRKGAGGPKSRG